MGLLDQLKLVVKGVTDIFSAPVGLVVNTAQALTSNTYNPGFFGVQAEAVQQLVGGLGSLGEGLGFDNAAEYAANNAALGPTLRFFFEEAERIYSSEFQRETGQAPIGLEQLGVAPGEVSVQRVGATVTGILGAEVGALHGGSTENIDYARQWQRAAFRTPGQAWVEEAIVTDFYTRTPDEQDEIRQTAWYNLFSGTIDAAARWVTDPVVVAGKSYKVSRNRYWTFRPDVDNPRLLKKRPKTHKQSLRRLGYGMGEEIEGPGGLPMVVLRAGRNDQVITVVRGKTLNQITDEGTLSAKGRKARNADPDLDERAALYSDEEIELVRNFARDNGIPEDQLDDFVDQVVRSQAADELNVDTASKGLLGEKAKSSPTKRYIGTQQRPLQLFSADSQEEALRYATALYAADPTDMPVILRIKADGLAVVFEEFDQAVLPKPSDYNPSDANFLTLAENASDNIDEVIRLDPKDLDPALNLEGGPSHLSTPSGRLSGRLYHPDGSPIEPDQLTNIEALLSDVTTAAKLYETNPIDSEKFLEKRRLERNLEGVQGDVLATRVMNNKAVQGHLNWLDNDGKGRTMLEIRETLFPNLAFGDIIAVMLDDATNYAERRTILLAAMGYKTTDFKALEPMLRIRLEKLLLEAERVNAGAPPGEMVNTLLGLDTKYTNSMTRADTDLVVKSLTDELQDQRAFTQFLDQISDMAPLRQVRTPHVRYGVNTIRRTSFYQQSTLARPIRAVTENRPHQWVNLKDPMSQKQVTRQMREAQRLGFTKADIDDVAKKYSAATTEQAREAIVVGVNDRIVEMAAKAAKMTPKEFEELLRRSRAGTKEVQQFLESRSFASDGKDMVTWLDDETGEIITRPMPLLSTQTRTWIPLPNAKEIVRLSKKIGRLRGPGVKGVPVSQIPREFLDQFYRIWKPTVLLRGGWMIRVVSDEQLRVLAKTGSLLTHLAAISRGEVPKFSNMFDAKLTPGQRLGATLATVTLTQPVTALAVRAAKGITNVTERLNMINPKVLKYMDDAGIEGLVSSRATFGGPSEQTLRDLQALIGRDELTILDHLYTRGTGQWKSITQSEEGFGPAWARVLTEQYGRDPLGRHIVQNILEGRIFDVDDIDALDLQRIVDKAKRFLEHTAEGREVAARMPWRSRNPELWVEQLLEEINGYTAGFDETLLRGIVEQKVTTKMMENIDQAFRPDVVHGEIVSQTLGTSAVSGLVKDFTSEAFDLLGRLPTDTLSRQPFFKQLYATEMVRLEKLRAQQGLLLDDTAIARMNKSSRQYAINETKEYLYDLAEVSRFGHMARFIMPFYPAWQEIFTVWGKIALQDPSVIGRAQLLWKAPNRAGMIYTDPEGEEFISFRLGEEAADSLELTGWARFLATGGPDFAKQSFNLVLNNPLPGVGPPIQYPVNEIVKRKPELESALKFLLPFGVTTDASTILLSPLVRSLQTSLEGKEGDRSYLRAFVDGLTWMDVEYRRGNRTTPPSVEEAHEIAGKLNIIRWITRLMAPAQPIWRSPLQPYIDIYRDMQDTLGPEEAHEAFLNEHGREFFAVTISRTVSKTGIPPTVEGQVARREFTELIEEFPEYGRLIVGDDSLGEFSTAAFAAQLETPVDPDNPFSEMERTYRSTELDPRTGGIIEVDRRIGWDEYIKALDILDLERKRRGLPNLRVKEAQDLSDAKAATIEFLKEKYPSWYEDFNTRDSLKWGRRIEAFRTITKNPVIGERADIQGLTIYLQLREFILAELNRRKMIGGASTLDAGSNQDLQFQWDSMVFALLDENIAFGPLYYRYLEGDPVRLK